MRCSTLFRVPRGLLLAALLGVATPATAFHFPWDQGHDTCRPQAPPPPGEDCDKCNAQGSPFVVATGAYRAAVTDVFVPGRVSLEIERVFHGRDLHNGMFGLGWTFNYGVRLIEVTDGLQRHVIVRRENGQRDRFLLASDGSFVAPPDVIEVLTRRPGGGFVLSEQDSSRLEFDSAGLLEAIEDRNGNRLSLAYDPTGFLVGVADGQGRTLSLTKGPNGKIASITDPAGRTVGYEYDVQARLVRVIDPTGAPTEYQYDGAGNLIAVLDAEGVVQSSITYDSLGRVSTYTDQGELYRLTYLTNPDRVEERDSQNNRRQLYYNQNLNRTRTVDVLGGETLLQYDADFNVASVVDPNGNPLVATYDANGNFLSLADALGNTTSFTYEPTFNRVRTVTDPLGNTITYGYDAAGNLTSITDAIGGVKRMTYGAEGDLLTETDALGNTTTFQYDANGDLVRIVDPLGNVELKSYDSVGNTTSVTNANGDTTTFEYDGNNRLIRSTDALGGTASFAYDQRGNLTSFTDANGRFWTFDYDSFSRLVGRTNPLGVSESMQYDTKGNVTSYTDGRGMVTTFAYDALNRLIAKTTPDNSVSYSYDAVGNLLTTVDDDSELSFQYDALNRLEEVTTAATAAQPATTVAYAYDGAGNRISMTDPQGGVTTYAYDALNRLVQMTDPAGHTTSFTYDGESRRTRIDLANGTLSELAYDAVGRLTSLVHRDPGSAPLASFDYAYDAVGNRVATTDLDGVNSYAYDALDRLIAAGHPQPGSPAEAYSYDAEGNRLASHLSSSHLYDAANRLIEDDAFAYAYDGNGNLIRKTSKSTAGVTSYSWDAENRLTRVDFPDGSFATYRYDPLGRRIESAGSVGAATRYIYDGEDVLAEYDGAGAVAVRYTHGPGLDEPIVREEAGIGSFYHADALGSIVLLTDAAGGEVQSYLYDSFGRLLEESGGVQSPYRFTGRETAADGSYYFRARYYDPALGRYLSRQIPVRPPDPHAVVGDIIDEASIFNPVGVDLDPAVGERLFGGPMAALTVPFSAPVSYVYGFNNPLSLADPSGENPALIRALLIAARAAARYAKQAARFCKKVRCKIAIHGPHHHFGWPFNKKMCHVQLNCWIKGKKGAGLVMRIPYPCGK